MNLLLSLLMVSSLQQSKAANCGSQIVDWPVGVNKACGAQLIYNGGAQVGATSGPQYDPANQSEATFICTEEGWTYVSGSCSIKRDYACVAKKIASVNQDYARISEFHITAILDAKNSLLRPLVVEAVNACDSGK